MTLSERLQTMANILTLWELHELSDIQAWEYLAVLIEEPEAIIYH